MVTQLEAKKHYLNLYDTKAVYVWGMNANDIITKESIDRTFKLYGDSKYNRAYYNYKLSVGKGKIGSDCSGAHKAISGYDTTAQEYYNRCPKRDVIINLPKDKLVLLFYSPTNSTSNIKHTGVYLGDGTCFHMASSTRNAVIENVSVHGWQYWGYADFISDYDTFNFDYITKIPSYTRAEFIADVCTILGVKTAKAALSRTVTISMSTNSDHPLVTPLERYLKALGYYRGTIEIDSRKPPKFGVAMFRAVMQYQEYEVNATKANQDGIITARNATWSKLLGLS